MSLATILVEDSSTIRESLIPAMVELADMRVLTVAETSPEAVAALETHRDIWQIAVVDLFLRQGTGFDVLRACQERSRHQRVVVLTNYATDQIRRRCLELGADGVFDKSIELDAFFNQCVAYSEAQL